MDINNLDTNDGQNDRQTTFTQEELSAAVEAALKNQTYQPVTLAELLTVPVFKARLNGKVYPPDASGVISRHVADVAVIFAGGRFSTSGRIYLRKMGKRITADFSFTGNRQTQAIEALDAAGEDEIRTFRAHIAAEWHKWWTDVQAKAKADGTAVVQPKHGETLVNDEASAALFGE